MMEFSSDGQLSMHVTRILYLCNLSRRQLGPYTLPKSENMFFFREHKEKICFVFCVEVFRSGRISNRSAGPIDIWSS
jgi:hypothetical protein